VAYVSRVTQNYDRIAAKVLTRDVAERGTAAIGSDALGTAADRF